jgi:hypothetical protein
MSEVDADRPIKMGEGSYSFVEKPLSEMYSVLIKHGVYTGTIITYGKVQVVSPEGEKEGPAVLRFSYKTEEACPRYTIEELDSSPEFKNVVGGILLHILSSSLESGNYKLGKPSNNTENNVSATNDDSSEAS